MAIDSALEDFLKRFGDTDPNKKMIQNEYRTPGAIKTSQELEDDANRNQGFGNLSADGFEVWKKDREGSYETGSEKRFTSKTDRISDRIDRAADSGNIEKVDRLTDKLNKAGEKFDDNQGEGISGSKVAGYADLAIGAYQIAGNFQGDQFDTSAEGGGPGKAGGAIVKGTADGAAAGMVFGPWGAAVGALAGGLASTIGHSKAMKEWREKQVKHNLALNAEELMVRQDEYSRSEGLASMENLKSLREKQLGIVT